MKSSSTGSPFLSYIQARNSSRFSPAESTSTMTQMEMLVLKEFAPRIFQALTKHESVLKVTVAIYHSVEMSGGFLAKTTCLIADGEERLKSVIEFYKVKACQLSMPEKLGMQLVSQGHHRREYLASTSPPTLRRVQNLKLAISSNGLLHDQFQE